MFERRHVCGRSHECHMLLRTRLLRTHLSLQRLFAQPLCEFRRLQSFEFVIRLCVLSGMVWADVLGSN